MSTKITCMQILQYTNTPLPLTDTGRCTKASKSTFSYCSNTPKSGVWTKFKPFENSEISSFNAKFTEVEGSSTFTGHTNAINVNGF